MPYPKHFPNDCPPSECDIASGEFYRYIKNQKPCPEDFLSWREENPEKECPKGTSECQACGVSIYLSLDDAKKLSRRVAYFRNKKIAKGTLSDELGRIKNTPSNVGKSHYTWWIPENKEPWKVFEPIDDNQENSNKK
ncbi:hypothetical protein DSM106972_075500 [Dulcicalothrix desertica PCC 7102]|uniref:Uncharacterized protein n=1 Tax=Dulcicalothrix desertica PCC 7102 TaxID=232991 RepID=A0A433V2U7_9CYAN|nr:hypothetical protein [Dulcicalothrix desertica]RUT00422.1 hypothetical protein DSM106972_075500 [Dulcicalothrix desertica PCC 7102]TWH42528.1 hypothetical protein CAL7102_06191 [Dulcicalothrix desertica PCC 7102]